MVGEFPLIQKESIRKKLTEVKKLIVTGATGGIGSEIARLASANDYIVGLIDKDEEKLTSLSKQIDNSVPLLADVTSDESIKAALNNFSEIYENPRNSLVIKNGNKDECNRCACSYSY